MTDGPHHRGTLARAFWSIPYQKRALHFARPDPGPCVTGGFMSADSPAVYSDDEYDLLIHILEIIDAHLLPDGEDSLPDPEQPVDSEVTGRQCQGLKPEATGMP